MERQTLLSILGTAFVLGIYIVYLTRKLEKSFTQHLDTATELRVTQERLTSLQRLYTEAPERLKEQYQARLDQADARLDDQRSYIVKIEEENKALLDRCLAKNNFTPIHQAPSIPRSPSLPPSTLGAGSLGQRAQAAAASSYQQNVEQAAKEYLDFINAKQMQSLSQNGEQAPPQEGE